MPIFVTDLVVVQRFATSLYAVQVGQTTMAQVNNEISNASGDLDKVCNKFFNLSFGSVPVATVASTLVANLGITTGAADAVTYITSALNAVPATARGAKVSELLNLFSNLEDDAVYGNAAKAWNAKIAGAVAYTGVSDVALNAGAVFELTTGVDKVLGTVGNDTIVSEANTLNDADKIDGGAGTDTLTVFAKTNGNYVVSPITTSVENVKIQAQFLSNNTSDNNLNSTDRVQIDANRMSGVTQWESNNSRETLVVEDVRIADAQITKDITITFRESDPGNVDYGVYFDQNSLRNVSASTSRINLQVLDTGAAADGRDPLLNADVQGFTFEYTDNKTGVKATATLASNAINAATTFAALRDAFQAAANSVFGSGVVTVSLGANFSVVDPLSTKTVTGTNVVLQVNGDFTVNVTGPGLGWTKSGSTPAGSNIYTNFNTGATTSTDPVTSKIILDDVGRGSHGGDLVVGGLSVGDTSTSKGVERFEITVEDNSKLTSIASTNNTLREVTIVNGTTTRVNNAYNDNVKDAGNLAVKSNEVGTNLSSLPGQSSSVAGFTDVRLIDASAFKGKLDISAAITGASVAKYLTLVDGVADYTADNVAFVYSGGSNADTLDIHVNNQYVTAASMPSLSDREDFGLTINGNAGNDKITVRHVDNLSAENRNINVIRVNGGEGNDTITSTGEGNITVDGGIGDDVVYLNQSGTNNAFANSSWKTAPGFNTPNGFNKFLYGGQLTVSFAPSNGVTAAALADAVSANFTNGYEVTVAIPTGANATLNQFYLNQAIKNAINNNAVLNKLLKAEDMPGTQLKITSLIDGVQNLAEDLVMRVSAADITSDAAALAAYKLYMADSTLSGAAAQTANQETINNVTDGLNTVLLNTWTPSATSGAAGLEGDNRIDLGIGSDVVVLGSNANSNDTVVFNGYDLGVKTVVNFNDTNGTVGSDYLDFTSYLTSRIKDAGGVDQGIRLVTTLNADASVEANSVTRLTGVAYTGTDTFAGLTADKLLAAINGVTAYAGLVGGTLDAVNYGIAANGLVNEGKAVVMVENTANEGYFRVFELTFAAGSAQFTTAKLIADVDFGARPDLSGTSTANDNLI